MFQPLENHPSCPAGVQRFELHSQSSAAASSFRCRVSHIPNTGDGITIVSVRIDTVQKGATNESEQSWINCKTWVIAGILDPSAFQPNAFLFTNDLLRPISASLFPAGAIKLSRTFVRHTCKNVATTEVTTFAVASDEKMLVQQQRNHEEELNTTNGDQQPSSSYNRFIGDEAGVKVWWDQFSKLVGVHEEEDAAKLYMP